MAGGNVHAAAALAPGIGQAVRLIVEAGAFGSPDREQERGGAQRRREQRAVAAGACPVEAEFLVDRCFDQGLKVEQAAD